MGFPIRESPVAYSDPAILRFLRMRPVKYRGLKKLRVKMDLGEKKGEIPRV